MKSWKILAFFKENESNYFLISFYFPDCQLCPIYATVTTFDHAFYRLYYISYMNSACFIMTINRPKVKGNALCVFFFSRRRMLRDTITAGMWIINVLLIINHCVSGGRTSRKHGLVDHPHRISLHPSVLVFIPNTCFPRISVDHEQRSLKWNMIVVPSWDIEKG